MAVQPDGQRYRAEKEWLPHFRLDAGLADQGDPRLLRHDRQPTAAWRLHDRAGQPEPMRVDLLQVPQMQQQRLLGAIAVPSKQLHGAPELGGTRLAVERGQQRGSRLAIERFSERHFERDAGLLRRRVTERRRQLIAARDPRGAGPENPSSAATFGVSIGTFRPPQEDGPVDETPSDRLGMTAEQWELFQRLTHGFPHHDPQGVDLSLLRENLKLSPSERLERLEAGAAFLLSVESGRED
ncbi:MAG: hypothetical protein HY319_23250 [Armatimonadetes bacterium]|nr:hypothetical protein [Armatimonadota bacterium]